MKQADGAHLSTGRNLKIALFHLGSGMVDVLATGVWNRIMVADLGYSAAFVGLLTGLRYFLAPLGVLAGRFSDTHTIGGYRRLFWIWLGRAMMAVSTVTLGFATAELVGRAQAGATGSIHWALLLALVMSFLLFSLGNALSGATFLALIHDRAAEHQRGRAVGLVWTFLLLGFAAGGVFFSLMLPTSTGGGAIGFSAQSVLNLFVVTAGVLTLLWFFSLLGEERRNAQTDATAAAERPSFRSDLALAWQSRRMRFFLVYLTLSMLFAFLQDTVLEPFAGQLFGMEAHITNRFSAYWGSMAIVGSFVVLYFSGRHPLFTHRNLARAGVIVLLLAYAVFAMSALGVARQLVTPGLVLLGVGLGIWNIGTLGLMMQLSPTGRAGTFLGFWTLSVTLSRGLGVAGGGIVRDLALIVSGEHAIAYGAVFCCGFAGLLIAYLALRQVKQADQASALRTDADLAKALSHSME
ncbi:MAG: BCD family MFS transporter [Chloroflexi bacterium]|nr:BCD family MFS transporter [Chloroflexota bacterium]